VKTNLALVQDVRSIFSRLLLPVPDVSVRGLHRLAGLVWIDTRIAIGMPRFGLGHGRPVLDMAVRSHETNGAVAVHGLIFCAIPLPHPDGRLHVNQDAVQFAKVNESH
jgi:hypothetical protein